ncbi:MAG TPA: tetratricopeptide repeat protein [Thermoanaerobaculia bacterium]|nr:tetratricopeptide repeat protein [Thermoanaerobaculia bacterium]
MRGFFAILLLAMGIALPGAAAENKDAAALSQLEAAVAANPDELKSANEYRKAVIRTGEYDRSIAFFEKLTADHPQAAYAWLNFGYAYVDKIPAAGSITQVILANKALTNFGKSIDLKKTWIALFTRGNSYLYWPVIFGRAPLGVADLEQAVEISRQEPKPRKVYVRAWIALGDGYWKTGQAEKAKATWREALKLFPGDPQLQARLARDGEDLEKYIYEQLDPNKRVDTDLSPLWEGE